MIQYTKNPETFNAIQFWNGVGDNKNTIQECIDFCVADKVECFFVDEDFNHKNGLLMISNRKYFGRNIITEVCNGRFIVKNNITGELQIYHEDDFNRIFHAEEI